MANQLIISENHVRKIILDELNDNELNVKFMLSDWYNTKEGSNDGTLRIIRREYTNDRFDVVSEFDWNTYSLKEIAITPMGIPSLNATYLSHPKIQEISYSPQIEFLISADKEVNVTANITAIEEVRSRLIQKQKVVNISQFDLNDTSKRVENQYKVILTSGELYYGGLESINGNSYVYVSLTLNLFITNKGEFANQEKYLVGTSALLDSFGKPILYDIPLITWDDGMGLDTNPTQLVASSISSNNLRASEVMSYKVSKAYGMSFMVQMDFNNEFLQHIYLESRQKKFKVPDYYIEMWTMYYDTDGIEKELEGSRIKRVFNLTVNKRLEPSSLGDKLEWNLRFEPNEKGWFE